MNKFWITTVQVLSGIFLCAVFFGGWGFIAGAYKIFPAPMLKPVTDEIAAFVVGGEGEESTLRDKVLNDFFGAQTRLAGHSAIDKLHNLIIVQASDPKNLLAGSDTALFYSATEKASGYYFFTTLLNFDDSDTSGVLLNAKGEIIRIYKVPRPDPKPWSDYNHGGMTDDGYVALNPYARLLVTDFCGNKVFEKKSRGWHHDVSGGDGVIWLWQGNDGVKLDAKSGQELARFSLLDLIAANSDLSIFESRLIKSPFPGSVGQWKYQDIQSGKIDQLKQISLYDPFHQNDIDVLTEEKAKLFTMFSAGDLLLSFRSINLVVLVDPGSLKVKWFSFGQASRQHDPDWSPTGEITVYDNQSHNFNSRVVSLNPRSGDGKVILDGSKHGLFQFAQGSHHVDSEGGVVVDNMAELAHFTSDGHVKFYAKAVSQGRDMAMGVVRHLSQSQFDKLNESCE